jgi:hypothetical protein
MSGQWTDCVIANVQRPIFIEAVKVGPTGWVEFTVDITVELTNHLLHLDLPTGDLLPLLKADPDDLPYVLFRVSNPDEIQEGFELGVFPPLLDAVTPNCPSCGGGGLMVSSVQAACTSDACQVLFWDVTTAPEDLVMNTVDQTLDPKFESP